MSDTRPIQILAENQKLEGDKAESHVIQQPVDCESFAVLIDNATVEWQGMPETYLIFIARLGKGETGRNLNESRLKDVKDYLKRNITTKYILAEGSRAEDSGRVEVYVGGRLRTVITIKKDGKSVCFGKVNPFL
ncbi:MAG: hypothetical protein M3R52_11610 [Acidobacteriota bacterium]|nr:hypothetical protein [Acidobacteriota bacterium]